MSTFASLVSFHVAGEGKDEISLDTLPGKFTVMRTDEALTPCDRCNVRVAQATRLLFRSTRPVIFLLALADCLPVSGFCFPNFIIFTRCPAGRRVSPTLVTRRKSPIC